MSLPSSYTQRKTAILYESMRDKRTVIVSGDHSCRRERERERERVINVVQLLALIMNTYCIYVCYCNMYECARDEHMYIILLASNHQFERIT